MKNKYKLISFIAILLGSFMALLDTTIINIALPQMKEYFNSTMDDISWIVNAYNLAFAAVLISASRLADQFGRKKLFIGGVFVFTATSFCIGISNSLNLIIFFRIIQGLSAAFVVPVTVPLAIEIFPPEKRGAIMGIWGAFSGLAAAAGPSLGGLLTYFLSWKYVFFINIPIGIICIILTSKLINESYDNTASKRIDIGGVLSISISMFTLTFALTSINKLGWKSPVIFSLLCTSLITLLLFIFIESKVKDPMIPLSLFKIIPFTSGAISLFLLGIGTMASSYLLAFFIVQVKELSQIHAGFLITSMALSSMLFSIISAILSYRISTRFISALGLLLLSTSCFLFSLLNQNSSDFQIVLILIMSGAGMGLSMPTLMNATVKNVPRDKIGITSGINNMTRTLGTVVGVASFLALFTSKMTMQMSIVNESTLKLIQVNAFSSTFRFAAVLILPGVVFAFFSDKSNKSESHF